MFEPNAKKILLGVLVLCFLVQTTLVYSDDRSPPLSDAAVRGRVIYHRNACQVCHQLYGQGGFLGPDLTNAARRVDDVRMATLLTVGSGQMPAMHFDRAQIDDVRAFLREIDRPEVGRGQLRLGDPGAGGGPQPAFEAAVRAASPDGFAAEGLAAVSARICSTCHVPFRTSVVGAPDLSTVVERLDYAGLRSVLTDGRPERGMPPPAPSFSEAELPAVMAWFTWLNDHRGALMAETRRLQGSVDVDWSRLPWWEFK
jgi:nitric oxide reductase subunit C